MKPFLTPGAALFLALAVFPAHAQDIKADAPRMDAATLCSYVKDQKVVSFRYDNDPADSAIRVVHPYGVGTTQRHSLLLLGEQQSGHSKTAKGRDNQLPAWRNFTVTKLKNFSVTADTFTAVKTVPTDETKYITEFVCKNEQAK